MSRPLFCEECTEDREYVIIEEKIPYRVKQEPFDIQGKKAICTFCGEVLFHYDIEEENQRKAFDAYREKFNLLKPEEIKSIRETYHLTAQEFSTILGFNSNIIARFERDSIQTQSQNEIIKSNQVKHWSKSSFFFTKIKIKLMRM